MMMFLIGWLIVGLIQWCYYMSQYNPYPVFILDLFIILPACLLLGPIFALGKLFT